jgi:hypothetical protein
MTRSRLALAAAALAAIVLPAAAQKGVAPAETHLPSDVLTLACAPRATMEMPGMPLRIMGGQDSFTRRNYQPGELVTINAGRQNGIEIGQRYYVRRVQVKYAQPVTPHTPGIIRTAGWIRVYAMDDQSNLSLAVVEHVCDSIEAGDYLEPFVLPQVPHVAADMAKPERDHYARILRGSDNRETFAKGEFFTIDRGANEGVFAGAQFVVYRDKREKDNFLYELGEAVAVDVTPTTSTLQVTLSRDAFSTGDYVAQRK